MFFVIRFCLLLWGQWGECMLWHLTRIWYLINWVETIQWYIAAKHGYLSRFHGDCQSRNHVNTLRPRQNGRHFPYDIFKCILLKKNVWISIQISLKFVPKGPINNISALVQVMAWRRQGDKPLSEPMMLWLSTHICVTRPQWVNTSSKNHHQQHIL